jgi:hypothetical protein
MIRFARLALCLAVLAAPAFLFGCNSEEAAKPDATPAVTLKPDALKPDALKPDALKPDALKPDAPKLDTKKTDAPKDDAKKPDAK